MARPRTRDDGDPRTDKRRASDRKYAEHRRAAFVARFYDPYVCLVCGDPNIQWHHRDPSTKRFAIGGGAWNRSWDSTTQEIEGCDPLCPTHHREAHRAMKEAA